MPAFRSASFTSPSSSRAKSAEVLDDLLDPLQALGRPREQAGEVGQGVGHVHAVAAARGSAGPAPGPLAPATVPAGLVEPDELADLVEVALEDGDVVADERQRVVDLVRHAGHHLAEPGELLGLDHQRLGPLEGGVGLALGLHRRRSRSCVLRGEPGLGLLALGDVGVRARHPERPARRSPARPRPGPGSTDSGRPWRASGTPPSSSAGRPPGSPRPSSRPGRGRRDEGGPRIPGNEARSPRLHGRASTSSAGRSRPCRSRCPSPRARPSTRAPPARTARGSCEARSHSGSASSVPAGSWRRRSPGSRRTTAGGRRAGGWPADRSSGPGRAAHPASDAPTPTMSERILRIWSSGPRPCSRPHLVARSCAPCLRPRLDGEAELVHARAGDRRELKDRFLLPRTVGRQMAQELDLRAEAAQGLLETADVLLVSRDDVAPLLILGVVDQGPGLLELGQDVVSVADRLAILDHPGGGVEGQHGDDDQDDHDRGEDRHDPVARQSKRSFHRVATSRRVPGSRREARSPRARGIDRLSPARRAVFNNDNTHSPRLWCNFQFGERRAV